MKVYIAGPISGREETALIEFEKAELKLKAQGYEVVNPMKLPHDHNKTWISYMRECLKELLDCEIIYMLRDYRNSPGARVELNLAIDLGIAVHYQDEN